MNALRLTGGCSAELVCLRTDDIKKTKATIYCFNSASKPQDKCPTSLEGGMQENKRNHCICTWLSKGTSNQSEKAMFTAWMNTSQEYQTEHGDLKNWHWEHLTAISHERQTWIHFATWRSAFGDRPVLTQSSAAYLPRTKARRFKAKSVIKDPRIELMHYQRTYRS